MGSEKALFSLKVTFGFGALFLAGFILTHIIGGYPRQPPWNVLEAFRGIVICTFVPVGMGAVTYAYQFDSSRDTVRPADVTAFATVGLLVWASSSAWQIFRIVHGGWNESFQSITVIVPWIACILQPALFWLRRDDKAYWGLFSGATSLVAALMLAIVEINDLFIGR